MSFAETKPKLTRQMKRNLAFKHSKKVAVQIGKNHKNVPRNERRSASFHVAKVKIGEKRKEEILEKQKDLQPK